MAGLYAAASIIVFNIVIYYCDGYYIVTNPTLLVVLYTVYGTIYATRDASLVLPMGDTVT